MSPSQNVTNWSIQSIWTTWVTQVVIAAGQCSEGCAFGQQIWNVPCPASQSVCDKPTSPLAESMTCWDRDTPRSKCLEQVVSKKVWWLSFWTIPIVQVEESLTSVPRTVNLRSKIYLSLCLSLDMSVCLSVTSQPCSLVKEMTSLHNGILGQVWCLVVSIPDLCPLSLFWITILYTLSVNQAFCESLNLLNPKFNVKKSGNCVGLFGSSIIHNHVSL